MKLAPETGPVLFRQVTVALAVIPVITHDIVALEPFLTSLLIALTSEM